MNESKYTFLKLRAHTKNICTQISPILNKHLSDTEKAFTNFDLFREELEQQPKSLIRNVKMMLACTLLNHVYSALILAESGLIVDAILCERNAIETVAFHWLICLDPAAAEKYNQENIPRPVEVRGQLERLGADIDQIRGLYAWGSKVSHVGRHSERFSCDWKSADNGELFFGGNLSPDDQDELFSFLPAILYLFMEPIMVK
jgi:hypothetical protein